EASLHVCSICKRRFMRRDHLKRHKQTHITEKPIECNYCGRKFARRDAARRHEQLHAGQRPGLRGFTASSRLLKTCSFCAISHIRCSGDFPCSRCVEKSLQCQY
ncbi:uncharacterized protein BDZ83DRAFT_562024, partial [Colletotrichum acutatum]